MQIVTPFRRNDDDDDDSSTLNSSFNYLTNILLFGRIFREKKTEEASSDSPLISTPTKNQLPANSTCCSYCKTSFCPKRKSCLHLRIMLTYFKSSKRRRLDT